MEYVRPAWPRELVMVDFPNTDTPTWMLGMGIPGGMLDLGLLQEPDSEVWERGLLREEY